MKRIRFLPEADAEMAIETRYYRREAGPEVASRFVMAVEQAARLVLEFPAAGSAGVEETWRFQVKGFPHALVYRRVEDGIVVFAVAHNAREPNYWMSRK